MLELRNVTKKFGSVTVADNLSYTFEPGISYAIMGPSGTGKSTLLYLLSGLEQPTDGAIFFSDGYDPVNISEAVKKNRTFYERFLLHSLGLVFQAPCLVPELSVLENISIKGLIVGMSSSTMHERATYLLHQVGLAELVHQPITVLSGGQQQRVALARALFLLPNFLLLDEPTAHVDAHTAQELLLLLQQVQKSEGVGCILVSHDPVVAQAMNCVLYMRNGTLYESERD